MTGESSYYEIRAASIGYRAGQALGSSHQATVVGVTSRGLFLRPAGRWLLFLSYESYRSPLTITLERPARALQTLGDGDAAAVTGRRLSFPSAKVDVLLPAAVWRPSAPPATLDPLPDRVERLQQMSHLVAAAGQEQEFGRLLRLLLSLPVETPPAGELRALVEIVRALQQKLRAGDAVGAAAAAGRLLGRGRGLTASGDDFLAGFLLFANRYPAAAPPDFPLRPFNRAVVDAAYERTTTISANLIECAAAGHADERLLAAAGCIAAGTPTAYECLPALLGWGASSGVDALAGMACSAAGANTAE